MLRWRCVNKGADDPLPEPPLCCRKSKEHEEEASVLCVSTKCQQLGHKPQQTHTNNPRKGEVPLATPPAPPQRRRWPESTSWKNKSIARSQELELATVAVALALTALSKPGRNPRVTWGLGFVRFSLPSEESA